MDLVKADIRKAALAVAPLVAIIGDRMYPKHLSGIENPVYPCVTVITKNDETMVSGFAGEGLYQLDIWSKKGNSELWAIHNLLRPIFDLKRNIGAVIEYGRYTYADDDLYEKETQTYHLASRYKFIIRREV